MNPDILVERYVNAAIVLLVGPISSSPSPCSRSSGARPKDDRFSAAIASRISWRESA
jgi:hypothetical protein